MRTNSSDISTLKKVAAAAAATNSLQLCLTLRDPVDCSLPGSSVRGSFQARVLEWVAIAFSIIVLYHFVLYNVLCGERRFHHLIKISSNPHPQFFHILSHFKHLLKFSTGSGRFKREGSCVYPRLIHTGVWQKPTQSWKAIIFQLKH